MINELPRGKPRGIQEPTRKISRGKPRGIRPDKIESGCRPTSHSVASVQGAFRSKESDVHMRCEMKPRIDRTAFGSITIDGALFEHDVIIRLNGRAEKRKKKLSKAVYGTSHIISLAEAEHVFEKGPKDSSSGPGRVAWSSSQTRQPTISSARIARSSCCPRPGRSRPGTKPKAP